MRFEELNVINIRKTGFSIFAFKMNREMKNVKREFKGIRENYTRCMFGFYKNKKRIAIHLLFFMFEINK